METIFGDGYAQRMVIVITFGNVYAIKFPFEPAHE